MSNRYHKAIIAAIIMVRVRPLPGKGKGKSQSDEFQLQQIKMTQTQKEVLADYDERLWALCYPEKEDNTPSRTTIAMTFWDDNQWTRPLPINFIETRYDNKQNDSVFEVKTNCYLKHFESALNCVPNIFLYFHNTVSIIVTINSVVIIHI